MQGDIKRTIGEPRFYIDQNPQENLVLGCGPRCPTTGKLLNGWPNERPLISIQDELPEDKDRCSYDDS